MRRNKGWRSVMSPRLVDDELWELIAPLLPPRPRRYRYPGRRRLDDRKVLNGILFVLTTGIAWQRLPQELGFGSGMTCWRRLRRLRLRHATRALGGGKTGPSPVDRAKTGSKHHLITDAN